MPKRAAPTTPATAMSSVRAVDRAIAILQSFTPEEPAMSVLELQRRVGLSRPTLYRLLHTLASRGLIDALGDPQRFRLAHGVMQLSHVWLKGLDTISVARPVLENLRESTGETAALFSLQGDRVICVLEYKSPHVLSISRGVGHAVKTSQGATGKAILSRLDEERRAEVFRRIGNDADQSELRKAIEAVRRQGYAISRGEIFAGAVAIAAPIFDHQTIVVGSVGLYGPTARLNDERVLKYAKVVVEAARQISKLLGFPANLPDARDALEVSRGKRRAAVASRGRKS
jgi:IclR family transcriptional regulator, acetate operon repressor